MCAPAVCIALSLPTSIIAEKERLPYERQYPGTFTLHFHQAANAARATLGINVAEYCLTEKPAGVTLEVTSGGASWGTVKGLDSLVAAGRRLVEEAG